MQCLYLLMVVAHVWCTTHCDSVQFASVGCEEHSMIVTSLLYLILTESQ